MQNETNMQDLFPSPNPFTMECGHRMHCKYEGRSQISNSADKPRRSSHSFQPNTIVALVLVLLLTIAFVMSAVNANLTLGTSNALWAAGTATNDSPENDIVQNMPTPSQSDQS